MVSERDLADQLRDRIVSALHTGHLHAGDRLPGIRELTRDTGVDHRVVARAYRLLEAEGLVEVRGRSGVYAAPQERLGTDMLAETARWMEGVLTEAWRRRITIPELPEMVRRCTQEVRIRCALVESTVDHLTILEAELRDDFGLDVYTVPVVANHVAESGVPVVADLQNELREADLVVTTNYHAPTVRHAAEQFGKPVVVVTMHPDTAAIIEHRIRDQFLTVVCADPAFGERIRAMGKGNGDRVRVVLADDRRAVQQLDASTPVLLTRAAHDLLGDPVPPLLVPHLPAIAPDSARDLAAAIIRLNLAEEQEA